jgi:hypothetical protein
VCGAHSTTVKLETSSVVMCTAKVYLSCGAGQRRVTFRHDRKRREVWRSSPWLQRCRWTLWTGPRCRIGTPPQTRSGPDDRCVVPHAVVGIEEWVDMPPRALHRVHMNERCTGGGKQTLNLGYSSKKNRAWLTRKHSIRKQAWSSDTTIGNRPYDECPSTITFVSRTYSTPYYLELAPHT